MFKQTLTTNTNTDALNWFGGDGTVFASGAFSGGSIKLQFSNDGGTTWIDAKDADDNALTLTANGAFSFSIGNCKLRTLGTGATVAAGTAQVETITAFSGPSAVAASTTVLFRSNPSLGSRITVFGATSKHYIFASTTGTNNIVVGASLAATLVNAVTKIAGDGFPVAASLGTTLTFTAAIGGASGNSYVIQTSGSLYYSGSGNYPYTGGRAAGVLAASGNINVAVTSSLAGTFTISVPVLAGDTRPEWIQKIVNQLGNDPRIVPFYNVSGATGITLSLTAKSPFKADDATLSIVASNGTPSPGLPATYTSSNITAGVATTPAILVSIQER
jgi:hypothetical protein